MVHGVRFRVVVEHRACDGCGKETKRLWTVRLWCDDPFRLSRRRMLCEECTKRVYDTMDGRSRER